MMVFKKTEARFHLVMQASFSMKMMIQTFYPERRSKKHQKEKERRKMILGFSRKGSEKSMKNK